MDTNDILDIAVDAGKIMLQNGGETYRVEETMIRISLALGLKNADGYATPTVIMLCCKDETGSHISVVKRILFRTFNLDKISKINNISRNIEKNHLNACDVKKELNNIDNETAYSNKVTTLFSALAAGIFTLLFGGNYTDFFIAFVIGGIIKSTSIFLYNYKVADFFIDIVGGAEASLIAVLAFKLGLTHHYDKIIIGSIMLLVPGLAITNAIRDTINGDLVSGISRAIEAFIIAIAIAVGTGMIFKIWQIFLGGV